MSLPPGAWLGPYQVLAPLGAGGMGEVYRAKDTRLGRDVAIKVLPTAFANDPDRLRRFEQEARAAGALNHPNILVIHDIGAHDDVPYVVSELLEGETLRARLNTGTLPQRKAVEYAQAIAHGLAAAHAKGIVHRDLKPENLFITKDSRVKILDFGLAKLTHPDLAGECADAPTVSVHTALGVVLGTLGYMSPEQVRGRPTDHRCDIFSFGAILYEMLSGQRAFGGQAVEVMSVILRDDPVEVSKIHPGVSPALERVVRRCLEKDPEERFQSARDLGFALEALSGSSTSGTVAPLAAPLPPTRRLGLWATVSLALVAMLLAGIFLGWQTGRAPAAPSFHRLTFRHGQVLSARFAPDGQTIVYVAAWDGGPKQIFTTSSKGPESRALGLPEVVMTSISSSGELAILLRPRKIAGTWMVQGTLARVPIAGGAPREILADVQAADWSPDGVSLCVVRNVGGRNRLEFPTGKVLYETAGYISHPRISPKGNLIAFLDHPSRADDGGSVAVVDLAGKKTTLAGVWLTESGLAWSPSGDEVWFTAAKVESGRALYGVTPSGRLRLIHREAGNVILHDVARDGRLLIAHEYQRSGVLGLGPGETKERELGWLNWPVAMDLSADGKTLLLTESAEGATYAAYIRPTDGAPAVRLGEGQGWALSPDGKWVLATNGPSFTRLFLLPTGVGEVKALPALPMNHHAAVWLPNGQRILFVGNEPGRNLRLYLQDLAGGVPRPITPEGIGFSVPCVSRDGRWVAALNPDQTIWLYPVEAGQPRPIRGLAAPDTPIQWSGDGRYIYVYRAGEIPAKVYRTDIETGGKQFLKELMPSDPVGVWAVGPILLTPDGRAYAYNYFRSLSDLSLVDGLK